MRPSATIDPAVMGGAPCVAGTRVDLETLAGRVWAGERVDATAADLDVTRGDVLLACWWSTSSTTGAWWARTGPASQRRQLRWRRWARDAKDALAGGDDPGDPDDFRS